MTDHAFRNQELTRENETLRAALAPFAEFNRVHRAMRTPRNLVPKHRDDAIYSIASNAGDASITVGHLEAAAAALNPKD